MPEATTLPENPLLAPTGIAPFPSFRAEHVVPGVENLLEFLEASLADLEQNAPATWEGVVEPIERNGDRINYVWGLVSHLMSVQNTPELREAHDLMQPKIVDISMRLGQSRAIFDKLTAIREGAAWEAFSQAQRRALESLLLDARLSGVALEGEVKERFNQLQQELAEASTRYANNVLDSTKAFQLDLTDPADVDGLPPSLLALAAQASGDENATPEKGPWRITLDFPSYVPFMQHSRRSDLREKLYKAFSTRASSGAHDNSELIVEILRKRQESARILGFETWAEVSLASKMAPGVDAVHDLLEQLRVVAFPAAAKEREEIIEFARAQGAPEADDMKVWDQIFWSERLSESRFSFTQEELRPYFPMNKVLRGLFDLTEKIFGTRVEDATGSVPGWNDDVSYFVLRNSEGAEVASLFLDPYARSEDKRGGAWMNDGLSRTSLFPREDGSPRIPVAYIVCNFTPPLGDQPALLTFEEVETMFHEFGHALQHMLTQVDCGLVSGIGNVEWDAVELPSQFMENWCYHEPTLMGMTSHIETGESLPKDLFDKIVAARTFLAGLGTCRQVYFALTDLELHDGFDPDGDETPLDLQERIAAKTQVGHRYEGARQLCAFGHIFAGGYAAGYYSYKWAEVLSADAFAAFEEAGLEDENAIIETGQRFADTVLALGGSRSPMEVFKEFRGREPKTDALLRHSGLV